MDFPLEKGFLAFESRIIAYCFERRSCHLFLLCNFTLFVNVFLKTGSMPNENMAHVPPTRVVPRAESVECNAYLGRWITHVYNY
jgi:hypothetical protein